jgi:hypothetical protein
MNHAAALLAAVEIGDPLTRGSLALFPLFHERPPARPYVTGPRGVAAAAISELGDGAAVPVLEVANPGALPLLLIDGETLVGAKQNRIVTVTTVVPAGACVPVSVACVEQGRWGAERPVARSERHAPRAVRAHNRRHVVATGRVEADQGAVWDEVERYAARFDAQSSTHAMEDVHAAASASVGAMVAGTEPLPGQCGVAVAVGKHITAVDLFDGPASLADYWDALVAGYALDADATPTKHPRRRDVRALLGDVAAGAPNIVDGRVHVRGEHSTATAALLDGTVVHLAVSAA